jgi:N-acetylmuramoyl-L-alanine amidase
MTALRAALGVVAVLLLPGPALGDSGEQLMARTAYFEARSDGFRGMLAVSFVIRNRVRDGGWGDSVSEVVHSPAQFSVWSRGGAARHGKVRADDPHYILALRAARLALSGTAPDPSLGATYFHGRWMSPRWSRGMRVVARVGGHIFLKPKS